MSRPTVVLRSGSSKSDMRDLELTPFVAHCIARSVLSRHGFTSPDLTRREHRVNGAGEATICSDPGDLPPETLLQLVVRLR